MERKPDPDAKHRKDKPCHPKKESIVFNGKVDPQDIVGNKIGWLTVLEYSGKDDAGVYWYVCNCSICGRDSLIRRNNLMTETKRSTRCSECGKKARGYNACRKRNFKVLW
jgi:hypothetical protein